MNRLINPTELLDVKERRLVLDVRSPGEYAQGHVPGAVNFPLFTDEERARVGTLYKQAGPEEAMLLGLKLVGPKMAPMARQAIQLAPDRRIAVHCWRGGQRSGSVSWLLGTAGFDVLTLAGGYKAYRQHVLNELEHPQLSLIILGGPTGSGKSRVLRALGARGEQILDLEALAHHKGSSFGALGEQPQPTVEQFENDVYEAMRRLDPTRRVWVEHESKGIGRVYIPPGLWQAMHQAPLAYLELPFEARLQILESDYAMADRAEVAAAFHRLAKRLGGLALREALDAVQRDDFHTAATVALQYYDKTYAHALEAHGSNRIKRFAFDRFDPETMADRLRLEG